MPYGSSSGRYSPGPSNPNYGTTGSGFPGNYYQPPANTYGHGLPTPGGQTTGPGPNSPGQSPGSYYDPNTGTWSTTSSAWQRVNDPTRNGTTYFNPLTGQTYFEAAPGQSYNSPGAFKHQGQGSTPGLGGIGGGAGQDPFWWVRNLEAALAGQNNSDAGATFTPWEGGSYEAPGTWQGGSYTAPDAWSAPDLGIPDAGVNIRDIVNSRRHFLDEEMSGRMADAARKLGAVGALTSSDYVDRLGEAERGRDRDLAALYYDFDYRAAQEDANRRSMARENALNRDLSAWGTRGGWQHAGQMGDLDRSLSAWGTQGNWQHSGQMGDLDRAFQAWLAENNFNLANNDGGDQFGNLQALLPLLMAGGGGAIRNWSAWL